MIAWLTGTTVGKFISTFFISMVPVVELRLGLPWGLAIGLPYGAALAAAILGNMLPVPFIIVYIRRIFAWLRRHWPWLDGVITRLEHRAEGKGEKVEKYGTWGLTVFVAIPLPVTGAITGTLGAWVLGMKKRQILPAVLAGVAIAGIIVSVIAYYGIEAFSFFTKQV